MNKSAHVWSMGQAKANLEEVVHRAQTDGPQTVTRYGKPVVVIKAEKVEVESGENRRAVE